MNRPTACGERVTVDPTVSVDPAVPSGGGTPVTSLWILGGPRKVCPIDATLSGAQSYGSCPDHPASPRTTPDHLSPMVGPSLDTAGSGHHEQETIMFKDSQAFPTFAVPDIDAAKKFYGETLGLEVTDGLQPGLIELHAGDLRVTVYPKPDHAPANFTILNFPVSDIDAAVDKLIAAGVKMQRYPEMEADAKGIVRDPRGPAIAWFTDPAGNIISVLQGGD
jgi:predicted enzyme related to lactoylglutathione lyase